MIRELIKIKKIINFNKKVSWELPFALNSIINDIKFKHDDTARTQDIDSA